MDGDAIKDSNYTICPTCKGKGYCEESDIIQRKIPDLTPRIDYPIEKKITNPVTIYKPKIAQWNATRSQSKPSLKANENKIPLLPNKVSMSKSMVFHREKLSPNDIEKRFSKLLLRPTSRSSLASETSDLAADLIGVEEIENPEEYARITKALLTSTEWSNHLIGLQRAVHLSRVQPDMAVEMGRLISRTILDELNSLRSKCIRMACQAAKEIFLLGGGFIFRPMFDEIVNVLLNRTADSKRIIREDAEDALIVIASYCPMQHVTRAFVRGTRHKNILVRKSALKMLKTMLNRIGISSLIKTNNYRDVRSPLFEAAFTFLDDPLAEMRNLAKELMEPIVKMPEFDSIIPEINRTAFKKVEKKLFNIKYDMDERKK